jgi:GT2 family glycosyltransferase
MTVSIVIPHAPLNKGLDDRLDTCIESLKGNYDELILVINDGIGYGKSFNRGFKYCKGDFIIGVSNDTKLIEGNIRNMCDERAVTFSENAQWGCFFCIPRWIHYNMCGFREEFGLAYWEDEDYLLRLESQCIPLRRVKGIIVEHEGGVTVKALNKEAESYQYGEKIFKKLWGTQRANIPL